MFLTSHIAFSVGWLGAVAVFLALAVTGLTSHDIQLARSSLIAMKISAWFVIVPFCLTALFTGIVQAVGTKWGLFKHYWIVVKLFLTVASTILLLLHMQPINYLAGVAADPSFSNSQETGRIINIITKAGGTILVLLTITTISVYKPWGKIKYELRNSQAETIQNPKNPPLTKKNQKLYLFIGIAILTAIIIKHLLKGGMGHH
jgi:hypothetical protein